MRPRLSVGVIGIPTDGTAIKQEETERKLVRGLKFNYKHERRYGMQPKITITQTNPTIHLDREPVSIELCKRFGNTIRIK